MKRFYKQVTISPLSPGFGVSLDEKPIRTPGGSVMLLATRALAEAVATEWAESVGDVHPLEMPLTRLALTQQDRVASRRPEIIAEMLAYANMDLLCYRSPDETALAERQQNLWDPLLDWFADRYGIRLTPTKGIMPAQQTAADFTPLVRKLDSLTDAELTAVALATPMAGSLVLGLALLDGRLTAEETLALGQLDELYQAERWGKDPEAMARQTELGQELEAIARFVGLNRQVL